MLAVHATLEASKAVVMRRLLHVALHASTYLIQLVAGCMARCSQFTAGCTTGCMKLNYANEPSQAALERSSQIVLMTSFG